MEIGLAVEFGERSTPKKAKSVNRILGTWGWACQDKTKQETEQKPCHEVYMGKKNETKRFSMAMGITEMH